MFYVFYVLCLVSNVGEYDLNLPNPMLAKSYQDNTVVVVKYMFLKNTVKMKM